MGQYNQPGLSIQRHFLFIQWQPDMLVYLLFLKLFLVHGPVSGLLELQPPEVRLKQAQTQIRVVESEWRRVSLWYSEVFLGLRGSLELCRACERRERWQFVTSEMRTAWEGSETCSHVALDSLHNICSLFFSPLHDFSIYIHAWGFILRFPRLPVSV